jgi:hypothetical protein
VGGLAPQRGTGPLGGLHECQRISPRRSRQLTVRLPEFMLCVPSAPVIPDVFICVGGAKIALDLIELGAVGGLVGGVVWLSSGIEEEAVSFGKLPDLVPAWVFHFVSCGRDELKDVGWRKERRDRK